MSFKRTIEFKEFFNLSYEGEGKSTWRRVKKQKKGQQGGWAEDKRRGRRRRGQKEQGRGKCCRCLREAVGDVRSGTCHLGKLCRQWSVTPIIAELPAYTPPHHHSGDSQIITECLANREGSIYAFNIHFHLPTITLSMNLLPARYFYAWIDKGDAMKFIFIERKLKLISVSGIVSPAVCVSENGPGVFHLTPSSPLSSSSCAKTSDNDHSSNCWEYLLLFLQKSGLLSPFPHGGAIWFTFHIQYFV